MQTLLQSSKNSAQIEILIPRNTITNQLTFPFPDQPFLRGKMIENITMSIAPYSAQTGAFNLCYPLATNQPLTLLISTDAFFITLQDIEGKQFVQNMPILELNPYNWNVVGGTPATIDGISKYNTNGMLAFEPKEIVWTKSYLSVPSTAFPTTFANDRCFQFTIFFK